MRLARRFLPVAFLASIWLAAAGAVQATVHTVPGDYPEIQMAIDASGPGDVVLVGPGDYEENIRLADGVTVRSSHGPMQTSISAWEDVLVTFDGVIGAAVEGFTIGWTLVSDQTPGGGVRATNSRGCRLIGNVIIENVNSWHGGGIGLVGSNLVIAHNEVVANSSTGNGAGIYVGGGSHATIDSNYIYFNSVDQAFLSGGGIYLESGTTASITGNVIYANFASEIGGAGGGIYCAASPAEIYDNTIVENGFAQFFTQREKPGVGAGIYLLSSDATVVDNIIGTTTFPALGWAVYCTNCDPFFAYNDVWNNDDVNPYAEYGGSCSDQTGISGNISANPVFCDPFSFDFSFSCPESPCYLTSWDGEHIGALGPGCGSTRTETATWGSVKTLFR